MAATICIEDLAWYMEKTMVGLYTPKLSLRVIYRSPVITDNKQ